MYTPWPRLGILGWMASKYGHGRGALETIYVYVYLARIRCIRPGPGWASSDEWRLKADTGGVRSETIYIYVYLARIRCIRPGPGWASSGGWRLKADTGGVRERLALKVLCAFN